MSIKGAFGCIKAFSETDFSEDLKQLDTPTLVMHGDADQIVPFADSAEFTAKLVKERSLRFIRAPLTACARPYSTLFAKLLILSGGQRRDRTADAGLFRAALYH